MQKTLVLMACSATKADAPAPALELYRGVMYSTFKANAASTQAVVILSAKHGFVGAGQVIEPYEQRMTEARADEMISELPDFDAIAWPRNVGSILLAGGKAYRRVMRAAIERRIELGVLAADVELKETDGAGIGYQRAQLGAYLRESAATPELVCGPISDEIRDALKAAIAKREPVTLTPGGGIVFVNYGTSEQDMIDAAELACPHCGGSGHKDDVIKPADAYPIAVELWKAANAVGFGEFQTIVERLLVTNGSASHA
jgi:hypothetical protein